MKSRNKFLMYLSVLISLIFLGLPALLSAAVMEDYCMIPPYVKRDVSVNIMVMLDNSIDMSGPAYGATYTPNATNDNYFGYFDPLGCYCPDISSRFRRVGPVNYAAYPNTGCTASAVVGVCTTGQYNGNILNWATMSGFAVAKKVINGGRYTSIPVPQFTLEGNDWPSKNAQGCSWNVNGSGTNINLLVTEPGAPGSCQYPMNASGWNLTIYQTTEPNRGVLQEFTDVNPQDENFDSTSPRFGITFFTNTGVNISQYIPPANYENFHNDIKTLTSSAKNNDLASAHLKVIEYFDDEKPVSGTDPYNSCSVWENPCISPATCRKSFLLMLTTGMDVSGKTVLSLPSVCSATETRPLVKNACYADNTDLRTTLDGRQNFSTYIIHTFGSTTNQATLQDAAIQGGGMYYSADASNMTDKLRQALQDIIKRAAAGTAASVLASGEGSGANLIQAVFYPRKKFYNSSTGIYDEISWIGRLTNLWFYVDPYFSYSSIREDTTSDSILNLTNDYITQLYYDYIAEATKARRWQDTDGDGMPNGSQLSPDIEFEKLGSLWEAGLGLWKRDINVSPRTIYTTTDGTSLTAFSTANAGALQPYLQASDTNEATAIIRYLHGEDNPVVSGTTYSYRPRTVAVDLNGDGDTLDADESAKVWKLGDILNSTPKVSSWIQLNNYDEIYIDETYKDFLNSSAYTGRGMLFAGANDGMLHAFKLGNLELNWTGKVTYEKARLLGTDLGKEIWAFIPKNALPYLTYLKNHDYCHVYTIDLTPFIFDASIGGDPDGTRTATSWRTILIGGMRFGGACRNAGNACTNCVKTPVADLGYSSYFALDITDQTNPQLLWEFSNENLGFTTTGPGIVRVSSRTDGSPDRNKNGHWFVVFGSGPTGPATGPTEYQFLGLSDQNLRLFILDLKTGAILRTVDTMISNGFAGSMLNSTHDSDVDYQDDAVYIPYVRQDPTVGTWTQGGVGRLLTGEDPNPSNWEWSQVIDGIGPVTSAVVRLQHKYKGMLWLYFGTGRYYYELISTVDDQDGQRHLFGITDPCFSGSFAPGCTSSRTLSDLTPVDLTSASGVYDNEGWYIKLDASSGAYRAERLITDPIASIGGIVFFTTYKPYNDVCAFGGKSFIWAVKYDTGAAASALLKGIALLQVSTGSIEQINLSTSLKEKAGRRTSALEGVPPTAQGLSLLSPPAPVERVIHVRER